MGVGNKRMKKALKAMRLLEIETETVIKVLKRLRNLYGDSWQLIEEDNYRALVDAIFEYKEENQEAQDIDERIKKDKSSSHKARGKGMASIEEAPKLSNSEADDHDSLDSREKKAIARREGKPIHHSPESANSSRAGSITPSKHSDTSKMVFHKVSDLAKGTEKVKISLVDEFGNEDLPRFMYCPVNIAYESAYVHVSLARIADEDCCSDCVGDCLLSSIPCECAASTGGEFAYTKEGLLAEKFLKACMFPDEKHVIRCQDCPLERAKNSFLPGNCKGHELKKFIKECWRKCGCRMDCGNRVVQRGISRKLQVFLTNKGKGWGVRALEELPQGAFICEYVGEILTNIELYERNTKRSKDKHVYPVLLDADWSTEENLKDEEALCLDATNYGNIARFINHRCEDSNLIEIPVQVETPDRHYYHVAFFTKRKVEPLEELTWDYKIDFEDDDHPIEAFRCRCGSAFCRDRARR